MVSNLLFPFLFTTSTCKGGAVLALPRDGGGCMDMSGVGYVDVVFVERNGNRETWVAKCPFCKQYAMIVRERRVVKDGCVDVEWRVEEACIHFCDLFPLAYTAMFSSSFSERR